MAIDPVPPVAPALPVLTATGSPDPATALAALARAALANGAAALGQMAAASQPEGDAPIALTPSPTSDTDRALSEGGQPVLPSRSAVQPSLSDRLSAAVRSVAAQAAPVQAGLAPMMADIEAAIIRPDVPLPVRQAAKVMLESVLPTERPLTSAHVRKAVLASGVFLEAHLARAAVAGQAPISSPAGDLKAALLVFRAVVSTWMAKAPGGLSPAPGERVATARYSPGSGSGAIHSQSSPTPPVPELNGPPVVQPRLATAGQGAEAGRRADSVPPRSSDLAPPSPAGATAAAEQSLQTRPATAGAGSNPQTQPSPQPTTNHDIPAATVPAQGPGNAPAAPTRPFLMVGMIEEEVVVGPQLAEQDPELQARDLRSPGSSPAPRVSARPPPPYAGGPTSPQAAVQSDLPRGLPPVDVARRLLKGVDGAIARQELLQIASLPEPRGEAERPGEAKASRWVFDLPFQTPQGVAVAQFEITHDGGGGGSDAGRDVERTWRARFSLDVEPLGPVHVQIALTGTRTRVGLWAERPEAMVRLQNGEALLSAALREADLSAEVAFHMGAPNVAITAPGHFVDRAS